MEPAGRKQAREGMFKGKVLPACFRMEAFPPGSP